ncbi:MAG: M23 family metallopeptidase, partial [Rikenellaceae bacterium]|nr:M23 family metallopeptidase [Rikenellaceae bacterium]
MKAKPFFVIAACCLLSLPAAQAQRRAATPKIEDLPRIPVDTVATDDPDTQIVLYTNNTWSYYRPQMHLYDQLPVFSEHWDTTQIFSYKSIALADLPERLDLCLINNAEEFHYPIKGMVRSKYGIRRRRNHNGVDIPLKTGDPIYATFEGKVRYSKYNTGGFGNLVIVRHKNGLETWYAHL